MKCPHCPRSGSACRGERVPRLCELVDPDHPDCRPEYLVTLETEPPEPPADHSAGAGKVPPPPAYPPLVPLSISLRAAKFGGRYCPEADPPACSCLAGFHCRRLARAATIHDCLVCPRIARDG